MRNDFPDALSPMLVKELRQGVRSRVFVSTFILLQGAMLLAMMIGLLAGEGSREGGTVFFWLLVGIPVLLILPMSGFNAVGGEMRANTLELIFLTRLTSWRIVAGKWLAIFTTSVLLVSAVLPYLVLRYFIGGVNLSSELLAMLSILAASALLTAVSVGMSPFQTRAVRGIMGVVVFFLLQGWALPFFFIGGRSSGTMFTAFSGGQVACLVAAGGVFLLLMLDIGASKIAPAAENHAVVKRAAALLLLGIAGGARQVRGDARLVTTLAFIVTVVVCAAALCEQPRWIPSIYRPFAARGFVGRILGRLLYPGWHTGVWFTTVAFAGFAAAMAHLEMLDTNAAVIRLTAVLGVLLLPVAITRLFWPKTDRPVVVFFAVQVTCLALTILCITLDETLKTSLKAFVAYLPVSALIYSVNEEKVSHVSMLGVPLVTCLSWITLLVLSIRPLRRAGIMEAESLQPALSHGPVV